VSAKWSDQVARLKESGLSIRAFAAREGVKQGSLSYWKWRLEHPRAPRAKARPIRFVQLKPTKAPAAPFELLLRSGQTVRVPQGFDDSELLRLVAALEGAGS
jgi:hypothetical protein